MTIEGNTFSSLIDDAVLISGRGKPARPRLIRYARSSMREAQTLALFHNDRTEDTLTVDNSPFIWTKPNTFRIMETVKYPDNVYPDFIPPGRLQRQPSDLGEDYYYAAQDYFAFAGLEITNTIDVSYFSWFAPLIYFDAKDRPAIYDLETLAWTYRDNDGNFIAALATAVLEQAARDKVTNWLLFRWNELVSEGTLAKQFKILNDQRAGSTFALFKSFQKDLMRGEPYETVDR